MDSLYDACIDCVNNGVQPFVFIPRGDDEGKFATATVQPDELGGYINLYNESPRHRLAFMVLCARHLHDEVLCLR